MIYHILKGRYIDGERIPPGPELTVANLGLSLEELNDQPLELLAREGARLVLSVALEEEVANILECQRYELN